MVQDDSQRNFKYLWLVLRVVLTVGILIVLKLIAHQFGWEIVFLELLLDSAQ